MTIRTKKAFSPISRKNTIAETVRDVVAPYLGDLTNFAGVMTERIIALQGKLEVADLTAFNNQVHSMFHPTDYGARIKTYRINAPEVEVHDLPTLLKMEDVQEEVVEEGARSAGNILLRKQDEEFRLREMLKNREDTKNYLVEHYKMSKELKLFLVFLSVFNIMFVLVGIIEHVEMRSTGDNLTRSLNQTTESFQRSYLFLESLQMLCFTTYISEYHLNANSA
ncbi:MAG: hypothetical protein P4M11_02095 [Candidatus Pacebacteria bacterium]|nr:hypothetical protein [Candidatus Paceibacterota bacterium]